jgi:hypothetical protein
MTAHAAGDKVKRVLMPVGVYAVADKYDIPKIYEAAADDVRDVLTSTDDGEFDVLRAAIYAHYGSGANVDGIMGKLITSVAIQDREDFMETADFERVMQSYPMFGADVALYLFREGKIDLSEGVVMHRCSCCIKTWKVDTAALRLSEWSSFQCIFCGHSTQVSSVGSSLD